LYLNFGDVDQFIDVLREMHERELQHKEKNNYLICPAIFNPNGKKTKDIEFLRHLWIDVEHGELPPERWRSLFPGIRIVVMSTFSHEVASPRYRVFIPTSRRLTVESYRYLWDHIEATLKEAGFWSDVEDRPPGSQLSGLDRSSRSPHQLYYAPCRRAGSTDAFFMDYPGDILDPLDWIREDRVPSPQMHALPILDAPMTGGISMSGASEADAAIQRWRAAPVGHGSREFFMLGMSVFRTHGNIPEVEATLDQEVLFARSPEERRRQIPSIIDWLTARRRAA
jgi:hypothetical protein